MKCDRCERSATHVCQQPPRVWLCAEHALRHEVYCKGKVVQIGQEPKEEKAVAK